jgi:hypothetical protein
MVLMHRLAYCLLGLAVVSAISCCCVAREKHEKPVLEKLPAAVGDAVEAVEEKLLEAGQKCDLAAVKK